jgi:glycosyltransferase involved in cell wall biosynthesis
MSRHIVMLGTDFHTKGGISSVVNVYRESGLFSRFPVVYLASHADGSAWLKIRYFIVAWVRFMGMLLRGRVAAVHAHVSTDVSFWRKLLFLMPAFAARVPAILHLHGADFDTWYEASSPWRKRIVRATFDRASSIIVLSRSWQEWARTITRNPAIVAIYNPVRMPERADFSLREPACVLFLGQLGNRKGTYDLLQAAARVVNKHPGLKLVMAGDGELGRVRDEVARLGLQDHVEVLDWVSGARKAALLERAAIYALPSYCEGLPMSVLEAMAVGLPIVCTPVGGVPEAITDGLEGLLVVPGDVDALSQALDALLSQLDLRRQMGEAARSKVVNTFSAACVLPQLEAVYRKLGIRPCLP